MTIGHRLCIRYGGRLKGLNILIQVVLHFGIPVVFIFLSYLDLLYRVQVLSRNAPYGYQYHISCSSDSEKKQIRT